MLHLSGGVLPAQQTKNDWKLSSLGRIDLAFKNDPLQIWAALVTRQKNGCSRRSHLTLIIFCFLCCPHKETLVTIWGHVHGITWSCQPVRLRWTTENVSQKCCSITWTIALQVQTIRQLLQTGFYFRTTAAVWQSLNWSFIFLFIWIILPLCTSLVEQSTFTPSIFRSSLHFFSA